MVREADRITREIDGWLREGGGCRGFTRVAVGLLKHREAARLKREGHWLGERKGDRVIREAVRLVTEREVKRLERERAARKRVLERFPLCCDCSGLVPFTMPCLLRFLSTFTPNVALRAGLLST